MFINILFYMFINRNEKKTIYKYLLESPCFQQKNVEDSCGNNSSVAR